MLARGQKYYPKITKMRFFPLGFHQKRTKAVYENKSTPTPRPPLSLVSTSHHVITMGDTNMCSRHGVPKGGQKEKKMSGFGEYIFGIGIPKLGGLDYDKIKIFHVQNLEKNRFFDCTAWFTNES